MERVKEAGAFYEVVKKGERGHSSLRKRLRIFSSLETGNEASDPLPQSFFFFFLL